MSLAKHTAKILIFVINILLMALGVLLMKNSSQSNNNFANENVNTKAPVQNTYPLILDAKPISINGAITNKIPFQQTVPSSNKTTRTS
jgi:hypothetical protein